MTKEKDNTQAQIKKQLEDMLLGGENMDELASKITPIANDGEEGEGALGKIQHPDTKSMKLYDVKKEVEDETKKLLKSVIDFYLDAKNIKKSEYKEYVKYKNMVDEMTISNIIFSLKTTQHAIIKLMEEIDMGNMHPRIFEVLAQLQNQMMVVVKMQAAAMITVEEGYKKIKNDNDMMEYQKSLEKGTGEVEIKQLDGSPLKTRGTKNLMLSIKSSLEANPTEDILKPRLTDPSNRPINPYLSSDPEKEDRELDDFEEDQF